MAGVSGAQAHSAEAAGTIGSLYLQGEYFWYNVDRGFLGLPSVKFQGGYAQAGVLTGESRVYNLSTGAQWRRCARKPLLLGGGRLGRMGKTPAASARWISTISLASLAGVAGGRQTIYTAALNWYVNRNIRFMLNYLHGDVARQIKATNAGTGSKSDAFAMRTQVAF